MKTTIQNTATHHIVRKGDTVVARIKRGPGSKVRAMKFAKAQS